MGEKLTVIEGKQYRGVERAAGVGERIKIIKPDSEDEKYERGEILNVVESFSDGDVYVSEYGRTFVLLSEYLTLEPVEPADDLRALVDGLTETVASLTLRVTELERKSAQAKTSIGDITVKIPDMSGIARRLADSIREYVKPKTRDEIVEQARKDIAELIDRAKSTRMDTPSTSRYGSLDVEFVINRDKRTVVALLRDHWTGNKRVRVSGKARCAPDDCFNAHIGRAIALRRALGLTVPDEYYSAPHPTEVRVGDIVEKNSCRRRVIASNEHPALFKTTQIGSVNASGRIVDDSREEVGA
jgi:hypothetical protein